VSGFNQHSAEKTTRWAIDHLPLDNLTPILVRGETRDPRAATADPEVFLRIASIIEQKLAKRKLRGYAAFPLIVNAKDIVQKKLIAEISRNKKSPVRCSAMRETAVVYPDGTIPGCELRDDSIGNLRNVNMDIGRIWRSDEANKFRERCMHDRCYCWHQCFLSSSLLKSPTQWPRLLSTMIKLGKNSG
jgi:MoaA/NifB/PqqE/SkfB family radical SAM enzyme